MSRRSKLWLGAVGALVFAQAVASLILPEGERLIAVSDIAQCLLLLSGTLSLIPNFLRSKGRTRLFWALMTLGVGAWTAYQLTWFYFEILRHMEVPNPFWGDIILFLHIVPMMAAVALQPHREQDERTTRLGSLDFVLLLIWWLYLYLYTVIPWQYALTNETKYEHNLNWLYLTEKLALLVGLALVWSRSRGAWRKIYALWFSAGLTYALSSYLANWAIEKNIYHTGSVYDVAIAASMAMVTVVGVKSLDESPRQDVTSSKGHHGVWVARLGMITIFSLPLFAAWTLFDTSTPARVRTFRLVTTLCAMLVMGFMVFLKQHFLDRELLQLLRASQESFENLRRLQVQLVQSEKLASLGQLVGGAAHELNNPLTAMLGYADLLVTTSLSDEQRTLAEKIAHQVRRTKTLVSSLLSFAKQMPAEKIPLDINALAQTAVKLCQPQLRTRNIELHAELTTPMPPVFGDSNQLLQVCLHIINNALHAMSEAGGSLTVRTLCSEQYAILEFADTGPGARDPERVFDPFYTTKPVGQGQGLGLSACYGIVQEHHGRIMCQNRSEGGASFRVELPITDAASARSTEHSADTSITAAFSGPQTN